MRFISPFTLCFSHLVSCKTSSTMGLIEVALVSPSMASWCFFLWRYLWGNQTGPAQAFCHTARHAYPQVFLPSFLFCYYLQTAEGCCTDGPKDIGCAPVSLLSQWRWDNEEEFSKRVIFPFLQLSSSGLKDYTGLFTFFTLSYPSSLHIPLLRDCMHRT